MFKYSSTHVLNSIDILQYNAEDGKTPSGKNDSSLIVDHVNKFFKSAVTSIRKATPVDAQTEAIKFTVPSLTAGKIGRLYLYIRSLDSTNPIYANDFIYKGKPFQIEFKIGTNATASAENIKKNANKWLNFVFGDRVLSVTNSGADVTISVANKNTDLRFYKVEIQEFNEDAFDGDFETVAGWSSNKDIKNSYDKVLEVTYVTKGNSGFGTYMFLLKNLRLPTNANMNWMDVNSLGGEMPMAGGKYTQYIIKQCTERPEVQGNNVVGQYNKSITTHILWVNESIVSAFEGKLTEFVGELTDLGGKTDGVIFDASTASASAAAKSVEE